MYWYEVAVLYFDYIVLMNKKKNQVKKRCILLCVSGCASSKVSKIVCK